MIIGSNLVKTFERYEGKNKKVKFNAVDDISIEVRDGEILGLLGPNGAGKTTLLRMLSRVMAPTSGEVKVIIGGEEYKDTTKVKEHIGYLSRNTKLYDRMTIREMLGLFGTLYGIDDDTINQRIENIREVLSLDKFIDNRIEKLSTGQAQRALIARCLIHEPDIYIFDEPTLGLDIISSSEIVEFMKKEKERGKTIIYSTHYMEEAEYMCDRIAMINQGKIICEGTVDELKERTNTTNMRDAFNGIIKEYL